MKRGLIRGRRSADVPADGGPRPAEKTPPPHHVVEKSVPDAPADGPCWRPSRIASVTFLLAGKKKRRLRLWPAGGLGLKVKPQYRRRGAGRKKKAGPHRQLIPSRPPRNARPLIAKERRQGGSKCRPARGLIRRHPQGSTRQVAAAVGEKARGRDADRAQWMRSLRRWRANASCTRHPAWAGWGRRRLCAGTRHLVSMRFLNAAGAQKYRHRERWDFMTWKGRCWLRGPISSPMATITATRPACAGDQKPAIPVLMKFFAHRRIT